MLKQLTLFPKTKMVFWHDFLALFKNWSMKKSILLLMVAFIGITASAQKSDELGYKNALGLKIYPGAISFKHFLSEKAAIEGLAFFTPDGIRVTGLYEMYNEIPRVEGLRWYIGGGAHFGIGNPIS